MKLTPVEIDINDFPEEIKEYITDTKIYDSSSHSDAKVYYSEKGYFIKAAPVNSLRREYENGKIFHGPGLGAKIVAYISEENDYLVSEKVSGEDLTHFKGSDEDICEILIKSMLQIHSIRSNDVRNSLSIEQYIDKNFSSKEARITEFTEYLGIKSTSDALKIINEYEGILDCDTFIHGDFCLPNIIKDDEGNITFIDCMTAGMGDKNIDIYWAAWTLWYNRGLSAAKMFLEEYAQEYLSPASLKLIAAYESLL